MRPFNVIIHLIKLVLLIAFTYLTRNLKSGTLRHTGPLRFLVRNEKSCECTREALIKSLKRYRSRSTYICDMVRHQSSFRDKDLLLLTLPEKNNYKKIAIPLGIKVFGVYRHFVAIIVDFDAGIIEYYDPLGLTSKMYPNTPIWCRICPSKKALTLKQLLKHLKETYGIKKVVNNSKIHQTDPVNCALFVFDRIYQRTTLHRGIGKANRHALSSNEANYIKKL